MFSDLVLNRYYLVVQVSLVPQLKSLLKLEQFFSFLVLVLVVRTKLNPGMGNKYEKEKTLDIIRNDKRVTLAGDKHSGKKQSQSAADAPAGSGGTTSSTMLFKQLQDEALQTISNKREDRVSKKKRV